MSINLSELANFYIRNIQAYQPGKSINALKRELGLSQVVKLASNENPLGSSLFAQKAIQHAIKYSHLYPESDGYTLKSMLAKQLAIKPEQITLGNGSDELIHLLVKSFAAAGEEIISSEYAFAAYNLAAQSHNCHYIATASQNWGYDLTRIHRAVTSKTKLIFIANPNNPTGTYVSHAEISQFINEIPMTTLVVLDEAYYEYAKSASENYPHSLNLMKNHPNLIILRTFSKIYGLAGIRLGYAISQTDISNILNRARLTFNINSLALAAAEAALQDQVHIRKSLELNHEGYQQLSLGFQQLGIEFIPSIGNFITINTQQDAESLFEKLLRHGVIVRPLKPYNMPEHLRISIGLPKENQQLLNALQDYLQ